MKVTRKFDEEGISFNELMKGMISQMIQDLVEDAVIDEKYEGISGGTKDGNETCEL